MRSSRQDRVRGYYWREPTSGRSPYTAHGERVISHGMFRESQARSPQNNRGYGPAPVWAEDLLRIARAVFVVDKDVARESTDDGWTREVSLSVPVPKPGLWHGEPLTLLTQLVERLTGDRWELVLRPGGSELFTQEMIPVPQQPPVIGLFSGGLDSLSWAATALRPSDVPLLLVTFVERGTSGAQSAGELAVSRLACSERRVRLHHYSQEVSMPGAASAHGNNESSTRTRGFLYLATAIRIAAAEGATKVYAPENGQIAFNPALNAARSAACSTRSVHPWTLGLLNRLVQALAGEVLVENPWRYRTKGEVCRIGHEAGLTATELEATSSCGRPPVNQRGSHKYLSCGRCWPCLVRQAGLHHALGEDRTPYWRQPWDEDSRYPDWTDLVRWLRRDFSMRDLIADAPLPPEADRAAALQTITRGRNELWRWERSLRPRGPVDDVGR